jgi:hypothetical protein
MIGRWAGKLYCRKLVRPKESIDKVRKVGSSSAILKDLVQNDLERPWLQQVRDSFTHTARKPRESAAAWGRSSARIVRRLRFAGVPAIFSESAFLATVRTGAGIVSLSSDFCATQAVPSSCLRCSSTG